MSNSSRKAENHEELNSQNKNPRSHLQWKSQKTPSLGQFTEFSLLGKFLCYNPIARPSFIMLSPFKCHRKPDPSGM